MRKVGAPCGGWVYWLLWHLPKEFKGAYIYYFSVEKDDKRRYNNHNYVFYRMDGRKLYDVFVIVQTSAHYWHITYTNIKQQKYEHFGYRNTRIIAEFMVDMWKRSSVEES